MASFQNVNETLVLFVPHKGSTVTVAIAGTYDQVIKLQVEIGSRGSGAWAHVKRFDVENATEAFDYVTKSADENVRLVLSVDDGGDATVTLTNNTDTLSSTIEDEVGNILASFFTSGPTFPGTLTYSVLSDGTTALTSTVAELNILDTVTATAAEINYLDITTLGTGANSKAVVVDASGDYVWPAGIVTHETATGALVLGSGASGAHHTLGVTAGSALEFRFTGTNTTGDMRGMYLRMNFEGSGGSGEAARIFSVLNNVTGATGGTINGAHISLSVDGASGTISGAGNAIRATIGMNAAFVGGGTMSGILIDTAINTAATITSVNLAAIRLGNADTKKWPIFCAFDGTVGSGEAIAAATSNMGANPTSHAIRVTIDGVDGFIPVFDTNAWT